MHIGKEPTTPRRPFLHREQGGDSVAMYRAGVTREDMEEKSVIGLQGRGHSDYKVFEGKKHHCPV